MPEVAVERLNYVEAVRAALRRSLDERPEVFVLGEDVGLPGGVFGATKGLAAEFPGRVLDTPISEAAILGGAVGAALMGRRPIAEIMWADFLLVAFDQLVNQAANVRYVSQGRLTAPLTVRMQQGVLEGSCAQHSQSLEALVAHIPGLRVGLPATAVDAYEMLLAAVACDDPVVVIENRALYFGDKQDVPVGAPVAPIGGAAVRSPGDDVTVVSWGITAAHAVSAASAVAGDGISTEVVDLRWLNPLDLDAVLTSVGRTGRLVVAHEANRTAGFGAEVLSRIVESGVALRATPVRVALDDTRIPAAPALQRVLVPRADAIAAAVRAQVGR